MTRQIAAFHLDGGQRPLVLGIDILLVKEVNRQIHSGGISPIPNAPPQLRGLMNLRGRVVTVIDLNVCLNRTPTTDVDNSRLLILKTQEEIAVFIAKGILKNVTLGDDIVGFVIDRMDDVVPIKDADILPAPPNIVDIDLNLIQGVVKLENQLIVLPDVPAVLENVMNAGK